MVLTALLASGCGGGERAPTPTRNDTTLESVIENFILEDLNITVGTTVVWKNLDVAFHTATSGASPDPDGQWDTGNLVRNQSSGDVTFNEAGVFLYFCKPHPAMQATVTVTEQ